MTDQSFALAIEANFDGITQAAFKYRSEHVYPYLESQGISVSMLSGENAVRQLVIAAATRPEVRYLCGVGHGKENAFCGFENERIFRSGQYGAEEVRGKVVHLLSCFTAADLGGDFIHNGCRAFFGYKEEFAVPFEELSELDELAESFFGSDAEIDLAFADGIPVEQIKERVLQKFDENIARLYRQGKRETSAVLESNRDMLIALFVES